MGYVILLLCAWGIWKTSYQVQEGGIPKWIEAHLGFVQVWRVTYPDGGVTRLMDKAEVTNYRDIFGGKIWIDYKKGRWGN
jgi:hypothetical protein